MLGGCDGKCWLTNVQHGRMMFTEVSVTKNPLMVSNQFCLQTFLKFLLMSIVERDKSILQKALIDFVIGLYDSLEMQAI